MNLETWGKFQTLLKKAALSVLAGGLLMSILGCPPKITHFTPARGMTDTEVTIEGKYFGDTAEENIIKFAGATATYANLFDKNKLLVKVPDGAKTGLISITVSGRTGYSKNNFVVVEPSKWTFMIYMASDNNLESAGIDDFLEMASVGSSEEVNIVVQMDRHPRSDSPYYSDEYGNWAGTKRFLIQKEDDPSIIPIQDLGEQNMGDPAVLQDFVEWAVTTYPAEHYALSIWNHGGGWRALREKMINMAETARSLGEPDCGVARAVAWDDTDGNDRLYMKEVQCALEAAKPSIKDRYGTLVKLDIVGFDACLMGMVEVAYAMRNVANFVVGSEQLEPGDGWPYDTILNDLAATASFIAKDVAGLIVTKYGNAYSSGITQSAADIAKLNHLCTTIDIFANKMNSEWDKLQIARINAMEYHPFGNSFWGVDLWDFADKVYNQVSSVDIKTAAHEVKNAIDDFVTNESHSPDMAGSHGIAIYFPSTLIRFNNDPDHIGYLESNTFMPVDFIADHNWDNWLQTYYANIP